MVVGGSAACWWIAHRRNPFLSRKKNMQVIMGFQTKNKRSCSPSGKLTWQWPNMYIYIYMSYDCICTCCISGKWWSKYYVWAFLLVLETTFWENFLMAVRGTTSQAKTWRLSGATFTGQGVGLVLHDRLFRRRPRCKWLTLVHHEVDSLQKRWDFPSSNKQKLPTINGAISKVVINTRLFQDRNADS